VAVGDFNGDGILDIAANNSTYGVSELRGDGLGGFAYVPKFEFTVIEPVGPIAGARINDDSYDDVAALRPRGGIFNFVTIGLGSPSGLTGSEEEPLLIGEGSGEGGPATALEAGDLDADGKTDLVAVNGKVSSETVSKVVLLLGMGDGTFVRSASLTGAAACGDESLSASDVAIGDADGDANADVVVACETALAFLKGDGEGGLSPAIATQIPQSSPVLATGKLDGDGLNDVVVGQADEPVLRLMLGQSDATFGEAGTFHLPVTDAGGVFDLTATDLNSDGHTDVVAVPLNDPETGTPAKVVVAHGTGTGDFFPVDEAVIPNRYGSSFDLDTPGFGSSLGLRGMAVADLNEDGLEDLTVAAAGHPPGEDRIVPLFNNTTPSEDEDPENPPPPPPPADTPPNEDAVFAPTLDTQSVSLPVNRTRPRLAGRPVIGFRLRCMPGRWWVAESLSFRWLRGKTVAASGAFYRVRPRDRGKVIRCRVTARNVAGRTDATSRWVVIRERYPRRPPARDARSSSRRSPGAVRQEVADYPPVP
jgi:hypothetical protein